MQTIHAKSPCCRGVIIRFGSRRRQCRVCGRTWRIRKRKRGRKLKRSSRKLPRLLLLEYGRGASLAQRRHISKAAVSFRLNVAMRQMLKVTCSDRLPPGPYVLVGDGLYFKFKRLDWVMYIMAVKPVNAHRAHFLDPILLEGKEGYERWRIAIATIPLDIKKQIKAFVSDGFRGSKLIAREQGWIHQRCHFHLLMALIRRHGRRSYRTRGAAIREKLLGAVRTLLTSTDMAMTNQNILKAKRFIAHPLCPPWIRIQTVEFLRTLDDFRAYLIYPKLNLPTTTNAIESSAKIIRKATSTARTPESVLLRAKAFLRLKKSIICNGKLPTEIT